MTEPSVGSDLKNIRLTAKRDGDTCVVDGTKAMITQARRAAPLVVMVRTDPPVEYLRICREWLEDGWERDLVFRSPADATA
ncbi:acyl-CoA dehydrogenase family protein [Streptomyces sp. NPDC102462]|uniref:acyl-CoA dehydrogenase family protein n=1 Tax=Streptomyces sp. NPDC102462 TaxID=3366178 RepID=UPI003807A58F